MTVQKIAREEVVTTSPRTSVRKIADQLREHGVGSVVVVEDGAPVGIVTDRDIALQIWEAEDPTAATAADVMTTDLVTIAGDTDLYSALRQARKAGVRRLPVTEDGKLTGIMTLDDAIVLLAGELGEVSHIIQGHSPPY